MIAKKDKRIAFCVCYLRRNETILTQRGTKNRAIKTKPRKHRKEIKELWTISSETKTIF